MPSPRKIFIPVPSRLSFSTVPVIDDDSNMDQPDTPRRARAYSLCSPSPAVDSSPLVEHSTTPPTTLQSLPKVSDWKAKKAALSIKKLKHSSTAPDLRKLALFVSAKNVLRSTGLFYGLEDSLPRRKRSSITGQLSTTENAAEPSASQIPRYRYKQTNSSSNVLSFPLVPSDVGDGSRLGAGAEGNGTTRSRSASLKPHKKLPPKPSSVVFPTSKATTMTEANPLNVGAVYHSSTSSAPLIAKSSTLVTSPTESEAERVAAAARALASLNLNVCHFLRNPRGLVPS